MLLLSENCAQSHVEIPRLSIERKNIHVAGALTCPHQNVRVKAGERTCPYMVTIRPKRHRLCREVCGDFPAASSEYPELCRREHQGFRATGSDWRKRYRSCGRG